MGDMPLAVTKQGVKLPHNSALQGALSQDKALGHDSSVPAPGGTSINVGVHADQA